MASLSKDGSGWRILFVCPTTRKRPTIRLGECSKKNAQTTLNMVETLVEAKSLGQPMKQQTAAWLESITRTPLRERLAKVGLCEATTATLLGDFLDELSDQRVRRGDVKKCTVVSWGHTRRNLVEFFGADRMIDSITPADADEWAAWLAGHKQLAENTVRKRSANAKMFFRVAVRRKQIATNPFEGLVGSVTPSRGRQYFIPRETVTALLDQCRGPEFRLLLLFARYMGCRVPSEIVPLTWGDVDWENRRVVITSPKTERHPGGDKRVCPIFPEVFPALQDAFDTAPEGEVYVFPSVRSGEKNLRTWLKRAIVKAGLTPWPRLWQNFRATRSTELADLFPSHVAAAWLGHTEKIADGHYRQVTTDHFRRATTESTGPQTQPQILAQNPAHSPHVKPHQDYSKNDMTPVFQGSDVRRDTLMSVNMGDEGLEPPTSSL